MGYNMTVMTHSLWLELREKADMEHVGGEEKRETRLSMHKAQVCYQDD